MRKNALFIALIILSLIAVLNVNKNVTGNISYALNGKSSGVISQNKSDWAFCDGVFLKIENDEDLSLFLKEKNAELVKVEKVFGVTNYYYYSSKISKKEVINGKPVNVHVAVSNEQITLGIPFIYGGY